MSAFGYLEGEACGREGCEGVIEQHDSDTGCCCHISPPCTYCTTPREFCPECEWDAFEEQEAEELARIQAEKARPEEEKAAERRYWELARIKHMVKQFDPNRINSRIRAHSNSSQIVEGWFPAHMSQEDVRKHADGTFGGRFESFNPKTQLFKFIAYTD